MLYMYTDLNVDVDISKSLMLNTLAPESEQYSIQLVMHKCQLSPSEGGGLPMGGYVPLSPNVPLVGGLVTIWAMYPS